MAGLRWVAPSYRAPWRRPPVGLPSTSLISVSPNLNPDLQSCWRYSDLINSFSGSQGSSCLLSAFASSLSLLFPSSLSLSSPLSLSLAVSVSWLLLLSPPRLESSSDFSLVLSLSFPFLFFSAEAFSVLYSSVLSADLSASGCCRAVASGLLFEGSEASAGPDRSAATSG